MRYAVNLFYVVIFLAFCLGVFSQFPFMGDAIPNFALLGLLGLLVNTEDINDILFYSLVSGLIWDIYFGLHFGSFIFGLFIVAVALYFLNTSVVFIRGRMRYLPLLLIIGQTIFGLWLVIYTYAVNSFGVTPIQIHLKHLSLVFGKELVYNLLLLYPVYLFSVFLDNTVRAWERRNI